MGRKFASCLLTLLLGVGAAVGANRSIEDSYRQRYENRALFLRIIVRGTKQLMMIGPGGTLRPQRSAEPLAFKVGDQVRILKVEFGRDEVKFKIASTDLARQAELVFAFPQPLGETFPQAADFDRALEKVFAQGLSYKEIEASKLEYLQSEFERMVSELAVASNSSRDFVLDAVAELVPRYREARQDLNNLGRKNRELASRIAELEIRLRRSESEKNAVELERARTRRALDLIRRELGIEVSDDDLSAEVAKLKQRLAELQRNLNLRIESSRDLARQIDELSRASQQLQREKSRLAEELTAAKAELEKAKKQIDDDLREITKLKGDNEKLNRDLKALAEKEGSLARRYLDLQREKDRADSLLAAALALSVERLGESERDNYVEREFLVKLKETALGRLALRLPAELKAGESKSASAVFTAESIDYVALSDKEREILSSLGKSLKVEQQLLPAGEGVEVAPATAERREVDERSNERWEWTVTNRGRGPAALRFKASLINQDGAAVPLYADKFEIEAPSLVEKMTGLVQPLSLALGGICGALLAALTILAWPRRRPAKAEVADRYVADKQL